MTRIDHIPAPTVRRLSFYLRQLEAFQATDRQTVSSRQLGDSLGLSDAQVRKDLAHFGQFGQPGVGYRVNELIQQVRRILGTDRQTNVLLVGAGNLGRALLSFRGFARKGFEVVAVFDKDPGKVGQTVTGTRPLTIQPISKLRELVRGRSIRLGIVAVPGGEAQGVVNDMAAAGIRGVLNFAPVSIQVPVGVAVSSVDLAVQLEQLAFQLGAAPER